MKIYAHSQDQDKLHKLYEIANEMVELLDKNNICHTELYDYKFYEPLPRIGVVDIYIDGDWKHDHLRADYLIKNNFSLIKHESYAVEDTGSDWGPEVHTYYVYLPSYEE